MSRIAFDTNVLVYAELEPDSKRGMRSRDLLLRAGPIGVIPVQVFGEFLRVVQRHASQRLAEAAAQVDQYASFYASPLTTPEILINAAELARAHGFQMFDAIIIVASSSAGANVLLSEDMQDGRAVGGLRILNPFAPSNAAAIDALFPA